MKVCKIFFILLCILFIANNIAADTKILQVMTNNQGQLGFLEKIPFGLFTVKSFKTSAPFQQGIVKVDGQLVFYAPVEANQEAQVGASASKTLQWAVLGGTPNTVVTVTLNYVFKPCVNNEEILKNSEKKSILFSSISKYCMPKVKGETNEDGFFCAKDQMFELKKEAKVWGFHINEEFCKLVLKLDGKELKYNDSYSITSSKGKFYELKRIIAPGKHNLTIIASEGKANSKVCFTFVCKK